MSHHPSSTPTSALYTAMKVAATIWTMTPRAATIIDALSIGHPQCFLSLGLYAFVKRSNKKVEGLAKKARVEIIVSARAFPGFGEEPSVGAPSVEQMPSVGELPSMSSPRPWGKCHPWVRHPWSRYPPWGGER